MQYTEADIPVDLHHGEVIKLDDGSEVRFETNGEAKDVFVGDAWAPTVQLFPDTDYTFSAGDATFRITALFEDALRVEKI